VWVACVVKIVNSGAPTFHERVSIGPATAEPRRNFLFADLVPLRSVFEILRKFANLLLHDPKNSETSIPPELLWAGNRVTKARPLTGIAEEKSSGRNCCLCGACCRPSRRRAGNLRLRNPVFEVKVDKFAGSLAVRVIAIVQLFSIFFPHHGEGVEEQFF